MPPPKEREQIKVQSERTVLAAVRLPDSRYNEADPFGELRELSRQAGAVVVGELEQRRDAPESGTYLGKGKVEELRDLCATLDAKTIIFDHELSPKQIAAIEKITERKVLDRSELILDIFASRATTHEAKLQVELAQLEYTYPRLRAMWDHLERIVGGSPGGVGTRGPGEQQLEIDRRLVQRRKKLLTDELQKIQARKRRTVQSRTSEHFTVGLVGYTNAGKSTLFNTLTAGGAYADDRVFATLMTRTREWNLSAALGDDEALPGASARVMLSDTVGFVRDLPHHLVASFRATLEEATHADALLIVLDVSDPAAELHLETVNRVLDELFDEIEAIERREAKREARKGGSPQPMHRPERVLLLNKIDRVDDPHTLQVWRQREPRAIPVCALPPAEGESRPGQQELAAKILELAAGEPVDVTLRAPMRDTKALHLIERRCAVHERDYEGDVAVYRVTVGERSLRTLTAAIPAMTVEGAPAEPARGWAPAED